MIFLVENIRALSQPQDPSSPWISGEGNAGPNRFLFFQFSMYEIGGNWPTKRGTMVWFCKED